MMYMNPLLCGCGQAAVLRCAACGNLYCAECAESVDHCADAPPQPYSGQCGTCGKPIGNCRCHAIDWCNSPPDPRGLKETLERLP